MPRGGQVAITLEPAQLEAGRAVPSTRAVPGPYVCLAVTDNGCGMEPDTLERIFEPFFTTKPAGKGTGLGLATVHGIVAQHRGWIEVDSEPGKGSIFRVFLPAGASVAPEAPQAPASAPAGGNETILLVEDEVSVRQVLGRALRTFGYGILEAGTGLEALGVWQEHRPRIRLLLTDMVMPEGMTGLELAERLKAEEPGLRVIICSGYDPDGLSQAALRQKGMLALPKPFSIQTLAKRIRECLDGHPAPSPR
jgi:CheY-like chemotaxis protein